MIKTSNSHIVAILTILLGLPVGVAQAAGAYSLADLQGQWITNGLFSGTTFWDRGSITIASDGTFSGSVTGSDNSVDNVSGTLSISENGVVTGTGPASSTQCYMDAGKTAFACTSSGSSSGEPNLRVFTKKASAYAQSDLTGTWRMHFVASRSNGAPWWERALLTVGNTGVFSGPGLFSDGSSDTESGTMTISTTGNITFSGSATALMAMDVGKTIVCGTDTFTDGSTTMGIMTKIGSSYAQVDLNGVWGYSVLTSGASNKWKRGILTIGADGTVSGTVSVSDGSTQPASGKVNISNVGVITDSNNPSTFCTLDADKTIISCVDTLQSPAGTAEMVIMTKQAQVQPANFALTVTDNGTGSGTVTSNPAGINCGNTCAASFASGTSVTLTATPASGSSFGGWSGDADCTDGKVTINAATACTATFNITQLAPKPPTVSTDAPSVITTTSAHINGTVNDNGATTAVSFNYGPTATYGTTVAATPGTINAGAGATAVVANISSLICHTTYHYQVKAVNSAGTTLGIDQSFTTSTCQVLSPGDANGDGKINSLDLVAVVNQILGIANAKGTPDCNQDNKVNSLDLICIANKILGL